MGKGNGLTRGDKRRNGRLTVRRSMVAREDAVVGLDLGEDVQMLVVCDHDSRVLARKRFEGKAFQLGDGLDWAFGLARERGFVGVTVSCEPTGFRWLQVQQLAHTRGWNMVCVQPVATHMARQSEDYTRDKSDYKDAVLIARLTAELRCYLPERIEEGWAVLRHYGRRRARLVDDGSAAVLQLRNLLSLTWPRVLDAAAHPFESTTWLASVAVVLDRCAGDPSRLRRLGLDGFRAAVRRELPRWGGQRLWRRIADAVYAGLTCTDGAVAAHRRGGLIRAGWILDDLRSARTKRVAVEAAMREQLDELGVGELLTSIPGLSATTAAQILAETGDPARFDTARSLVKYAGLNPAENTSAAFTGTTRISRRGRPGLRLAAWRATWVMLQHNQVLADRYRHLTRRADRPLTRRQAETACAASLLRWIHAVVRTGRRWDPDIAAGALSHTAAAA